MLTRLRPIGIATAAFLVWGLSSYLDGLLLVFLRQRTGTDLASALLHNFSGADAGLALVRHLGGGFLLWVPLAIWLGRERRRRFGPRARTEEIMASATGAFWPLAVPVVLTLGGLVSTAVSPQFPFGSGLALTLAYEGAFREVLFGGLLLFSVARTAIAAAEPLPLIEVPQEMEARLRRVATAVVLIAATAGFAFLTPPWFWKDGEGQGNSLKYLRMAAAVAGSGTLDIARADEGDRATLLGFLASLPRLAGAVGRESRELGGGFYREALRGRLYLGSNRATAANRAMFRAPGGGVFYIQAPGPGLLLVGPYLIDRTLNRWLSTRRQVAAILFWNFLGALLLVEMFKAGRALGGGSGPAAAAAALLLVVSPPLLLYTSHVYPELPAGLLILFAFRRLLMDPAPGVSGVFLASLAVSFLPWLHQKFSLAALLLGVLAAARLLRMNALFRLPRLLLLAAPLALSCFGILVYHHALTGSVSPQAVFQAVGRTAFAPDNLPTGALGLLIDRENGIFVYSPLYLLALGGGLALGAHYPRMAAMVAALFASYVLIIASFPYWPGAVSAVARYLVAVAPLSVLPLTLVVRRSFSDGVVAGAGLALAAASVSFSVSFYRDVVPAYETRLLLDRALYSDPRQYLPSLLGLPDAGTPYRVVAVLGVSCLAALAVGRRVRQHRLRLSFDAGILPRRATAGALAVVVAAVMASVLMERAPGNRSEKNEVAYRDTHPTAGVEVVVEGPFGFEQGGVWVPGGGSVRFLIRSPSPLTALGLRLSAGPKGGETWLRAARGELVRVTLSATKGREVSVPLQRLYAFRGPRGREWFYAVEIGSYGGFVPRDEGSGDDDRYLGCFVEFLGG